MTMVTNTKTGFRLPWTGDQREDGHPPPDEAEEGSPYELVETDEQPDGQTTSEPASGEDLVRAPSPLDVVDDTPASGSAGPTSMTITPDAPAEVAPVQAPARGQSRFLAELRKAMQHAAETAREEALTRLQAETKAVIEQIHSRSAEGAAELRRRAEEDIVGTREWSKAEIARIREETEERITRRKSELEQEIERHAAVIEREIDRIQGKVGDFESEMGSFFERLFSEEDPARFATMAQSLPEPPILDAPDTVDTNSLPPATATPLDAPGAWVHEGQNGVGGAAEVVETADEAPWTADPRLVALGLTPDHAAAAEVEALASLDDEPIDDEMAAPDDDSVVLRLDTLVPPAREPAAEGQNTGTTRMTKAVVVGLGSVAGIAGLKRQLGRIPGILTVTVSSSPEGEFVFDVTHQADIELAGIIPTLTEFHATVTGVADGVVSVTARDPDAEPGSR
jgi:hypothetical protein